MRHLSALAALLWASSFGTAQILSVPSQYPTIAAAIAAAAPGQIVEIAPGTYFERDLDFAGKAITVRGVGPATGVIIDGQQLGRGFQFRSGETTTSILEGVTIRNCVANPLAGAAFSPDGGGILCLNSAPLIRGCRIINCRAWDYDELSAPQSGGGGGIAIIGAAARIENCWIEGCRAGGANFCSCSDADARDGGGIWIDASGATVSGTTVRACIYPYGSLNDLFGTQNPTGDGCGIHARGNGITIEGCNIELNGFGGSGPIGNGAGLNFAGTGFIRRTRFFGNQTAFRGRGAGAFVRPTNGAIVIEDCRFEANQTANGSAICGDAEPGGDGAGLYVQRDLVLTSGSIVLRRCDFIGNLCGNDQGSNPEAGLGGGWGGGAYIEVPPQGVEISQSRFVGNRAGNGIPGTVGSNFNCFDGSQGGSGGALAIVSTSSGPTVIDHCDFVGNRAGDGPLSLLPFQPFWLSGNGGAIFHSGAATIRFSTFVDNLSGTTLGILRPYSTISASGIGSFPPNDFMIGSIIRGSAPSHLPSTLSVSYSNIEGGFFGVGNIDVDPQFVDRARANVHLAAGSPMIGIVPSGIGGNSTADVDGEPRPIGAPRDMGADQFLRMGTADDIELRTRIGGSGRGTNALIIPAVGDPLLLTIDSPGGTLDGMPVAVVAEYFAAASPLSPNPAYPFIHLQSTATALILIEPALAPAGLNYAATTPAGLGGFVTRIQAFVAAPSVQNGIIATTAAHDIVWP